MTERKAQLSLRVAAFGGLVAASVAYHVLDGWSLALGFFGCCIPLWFGFSLLVDCLLPDDSDTRRLRGTAFAMVDAYIIVSFFQNMSAGPAAGCVPQVVYLGIYLLAATAIAGPLQGGPAGLAGVLGCLPAGAPLRQVVLLFAVSVSSVASGSAFRFCLPLIWSAANRSLPAAGSRRISADTDEERDILAKLEAMQALLDAVSRERDEAQELAAGLQEKLSVSAAAAGPDLPDTAVPPEDESVEQAFANLPEAAGREDGPPGGAAAEKADASSKGVAVE